MTFVSSLYNSRADVRCDSSFASRRLDQERVFIFGGAVVCDAQCVNHLVKRIYAALDGVLYYPPFGGMPMR